MSVIILYISAIVAANLSVAHFGPWVTPINALLLIGLDLTLRDHLHDSWAGKGLWPRMLGMISAAGAISYLLNPATGMIALASVIAFCVSALADAGVYQMLVNRPFMQRANASNIAGALVDSVIFPTIAFGAILPEIVSLQFAAKVAGGALWAVAIWRIRAARMSA